MARIFKLATTQSNRIGEASQSFPVEPIRNWKRLGAIVDNGVTRMDVSGTLVSFLNQRAIIDHTSLKQITLRFSSISTTVTTAALAHHNLRDHIDLVQRKHCRHPGATPKAINETCKIQQVSETNMFSIVLLAAAAPNENTKI